MDAYTTDAYTIAAPKAPSALRVMSPQGQILLTLDFSEDGTELRAHFDDADLNEAAVRFVEAVTNLKVARP